MSVFSQEFIAQCIETATRYRADWKPLGGLVIVLPPCDPDLLEDLPPSEVQFLAAGWIDQLRPPTSWEPGVIAVTPDGEAYEAVGGDYYGGAKAWELIKTKQDAPA